jgi:hypothetical protein
MRRDNEIVDNYQQILPTANTCGQQTQAEPRAGSANHPPAKRSSSLIAFQTDNTPDSNPTAQPNDQRKQRPAAHTSNQRNSPHR